jgi:Tol biopolymer transport system component
VIADEVGTFGVIGLANFSASASGALIYGTRGLDKIRMTWMSRDGKQIEKFADPGTYFDLSLSADGRRLAFVRTDGLALHVWTTDVDTGVTSRATFGSITQMCPVWSPDGKQIAFMETTRGKRVLFRKQAGGSERELQVTDSPHPQYPTSWSPDGRVLLYYEIDPLTGSDIWAVPLDKPRSPVPLLRTPANEMAAQFSPDGRWVAYQSDDTGRSEVYVQQFQRHGDSVSLADKWQVSTNGGRLPRWRADGSELFYISGNGMLTAVAVERGETSFRFSVARPLFRLPANYVIWRYTYDASPDGRRFLVVGEPDAGELQPLTILLNWQSLLKDR